MSKSRTNLTLSNRCLDDLANIAQHHALTSHSATVEFLARKEARELGLDLVVQIQAELHRIGAASNPPVHGDLCCCWDAQGAVEFGDMHCDPFAVGEEVARELLDALRREPTAAEGENGLARAWEIIGQHEERGEWEKFSSRFPQFDPLHEIDTQEFEEIFGGYGPESEVGQALLEWSEHDDWQKAIQEAQASWCSRGNTAAQFVKDWVA